MRVLSLVPSAIGLSHVESQNALSIQVMVINTAYNSREGIIIDLFLLLKI